jgi:hypothetical protein
VTDFLPGRVFDSFDLCEQIVVILDGASRRDELTERVVVAAQSEHENFGLENNYAKMRFPDAGAWKQVRLDDVDTYLDRISPS